MALEEHTLILLVNNRPGVLSRVAGVFSRQGYNIETLCVAETTNPDISRITLTARAERDFTEKVKKQLDKLVDVVEVADYTGTSYLQRELMMFRVPLQTAQRAEITRAIELFGCTIVTLSADSYILAVTGSRDENTAVLKHFESFGVSEMNRTGVIAVRRTGNGAL